MGKRSISSLEGTSTKFKVDEGRIQIVVPKIFSGTKVALPVIKLSESFDLYAIACALDLAGESLGYETNQYSGRPTSQEEHYYHGHVVELTKKGAIRKGTIRSKKYSFILKNNGFCPHQKAEPIDEFHVGKYSWNPWLYKLYRLNERTEIDDKYHASSYPFKKEVDQIYNNKDSSLTEILKKTDLLLFFRADHGILPMKSYKEY